MFFSTYDSFYFPGGLHIYGKDKKLIGTQYTAFLKAVTIEK